MLRLVCSTALLRFVNQINALALTFLSRIALLQNSFVDVMKFVFLIEGDEPRNMLMLSKRLEREASTRTFPKSSTFIEIPKKGFISRGSLIETLNKKKGNENIKGACTYST